MMGSLRYSPIGPSLAQEAAILSPSLQLILMFVLGLISAHLIPREFFQSQMVRGFIIGVLLYPLWQIYKVVRDHYLLRTLANFRERPILRTGNNPPAYDYTSAPGVRPSIARESGPSRRQYDQPSAPLSDTVVYSMSTQEGYITVGPSASATTIDGEWADLPDLIEESDSDGERGENYVFTEPFVKLFLADFLDATLRNNPTQQTGSAEESYDADLEDWEEDDDSASSEWELDLLSDSDPIVEVDPDNWLERPSEPFELELWPSSPEELSIDDESSEMESSYPVLMSFEPGEPPAPRPKPRQPIRKKYKPVAKKVKPAAEPLPEQYRIIRRIPSDPMLGLRPLPVNPPEVVPTAHMTQERINDFGVQDSTFLWPEEKKLLLWILLEHQSVFAWTESERRRFRSDYIPPIKLPVLPHRPWAEKHIPIPPAIKDSLLKLLKSKIVAGVYEPSNAAYRSRWFTVLKKDGASLRLVHDLQQLNRITIRDSGLTPGPDEFAEACAGYTCLGLFDLYSSYDLQLIDEASRDLTTFQTPLGTLRQVALPMGWTNSVPIQQANITFILQDEMPDCADSFIDDVIVKGPKSFSLDEAGFYETIEGNAGIRVFIWEYAQNLHRILRRLDKAGASVSGKKAKVCVPEAIVVGHNCSYQGRLPEQSNVKAIVNWPPCEDVHDVRSFLGTCGVSRIWIKDYSKIARPLLDLVKKHVHFVWDEECQLAMDRLKGLVANAPCLKPIDYNSDDTVVLSVDSSTIAVGYILSQRHEGKKYPARYGSITWNSVESGYSQAKLELHGLYRSLRAVRRFIYGVKDFEVEVDAKYIKGMLNNPDVQPNATINRWIAGILLFNPRILHIPATQHTGADGLSRRRKANGDDEEMDDPDEWLDKALALTINFINPSYHLPRVRNALQETSLDHSSRGFVYEVDDDDGAPESVSEDNKTEGVAFPKRSNNGHFRDQELQYFKEYLDTLIIPSQIAGNKVQSFQKRATHFYLLNSKLMRRSPDGRHKVVIEDDAKRLSLIEAAHDDIGHKGFFSTNAQVREKFWWPAMEEDVKWYVETCHQCQLRQTQKLKIAPTVPIIPSLFRRVHIDTMFMPKAGGYRYLVQARCALTSYPEWRNLTVESGATIGKFIFEQILCRWGAVGEIVTDNGSQYVNALDWLSDTYGITHIRISPYNSQANGLVERKHYDVRESIVKAVEGDINKWPSVVPAVFWAERVTIKRSTGFSPYYMAHGVEPVMPFDIAEATYLVEPMQPEMTTEELIAIRARQLLKRQEDLDAMAERMRIARLRNAKEFEEKFSNTIRGYNFQPGSLVLVRNSQVERELDRKTKQHYFGPMLVIKQQQSGAYILAELDGAVKVQKIAQFRVIPYLPRDDSIYDITQILEDAQARINQGMLEEVEEDLQEPDQVH